MSWKRHATASAAVALQLAAGSGCYSGSFEGEAPEGFDSGWAETDGSPGPAPGGGEGDGDDDSEGGGEQTPPTGEVRRLPLRRLSHAEYNNTVRDLFSHIELPTFDFVPDPKPHSFDNDGEALVPSGLLVEQYATAADEIAALAADDLDALVACDPNTDDGCSRTFVASFGERAFRRPLSAEEVERFHQFFEREPGNTDFRAGVELTLAWMLQSPQFLYRLELGSADDQAPGTLARLDDYQIASRLSYFLWGSMPDEELFERARKGELSAPEELEAQAWRMLDDPRAKAAFVHFHRQWLHMQRLEAAQKSDAFPEFTPQLQQSMVEETERFIEQIIFEEEGTLRDLLTSNRTMVDARLAELYGVGSVDTWTEVELDPSQRAGVLSQASFLAGHAHPTNPSPVLRGMWVLKELRCIQLGSPPAVPEAMMPIEVRDDMTNREVYEEIMGAPECAACHVHINPAGYALEHYDAIGRWRTTDNGVPIDATGEMGGASFRGPVELAHVLADRPEVASCVTQQWLRYAYGGSDILWDKPLVSELEREFVESEYDLKGLLVQIVTHPRFSSYVVE